MKKRFLRFYDKLIIAALFSLLGLWGCARKAYPEKKKPNAEQADTLKVKKPRFDQEIIAMYGVRPTRNIE